MSLWQKSSGHKRDDIASAYNWFFNIFTISSRSLSFGSGNFYSPSTMTYSIQFNKNINNNDDSNNNCESRFLFQRISVLIQRYDVILLHMAIRVFTSLIIDQQQQQFTVAAMDSPDIITCTTQV